MKNQSIVIVDSTYYRLSLSTDLDTCPFLPIPVVSYVYMSISREDLRSLAHLARIGLSEEEEIRLSKELEGILGYVDRLQNIDTAGVPEAANAPIHADAFRPDEVVNCDEADHALILDNFPASQSGYLKAPAVFERPKS